MKFKIHHLTLLGQLLALAAVAVAEDVLEPVSGTLFCFRVGGVLALRVDGVLSRGDGVRKSYALEPTPPRERRRVKGANVDNRHAVAPTPS